MSQENNLTTTRMNEIIQRSAGMLSDFDHICLYGCHMCEEKEPVVLLPAEDQFWGYAKPNIAAFHTSKDGYLHLLKDGNHCPFFDAGRCLEYVRRPIDCRIFPLYPIFDVPNNDFSLRVASSYCQIAEDLPPDFISAVFMVCRLLNDAMPPEWKVLYNEVGLTSLSDNDLVMEEQDFSHLFSKSMSTILSHQNSHT